MNVDGQINIPAALLEFGCHGTHWIEEGCPKLARM
jgi:hypothetical protein